MILAHIMSEHYPTPSAKKQKLRASILVDYFIGRGSHELDTYRDPELYDKGAHSRLYRRDNLARGVADITEQHMPHGHETKVLDIGAGTGILSLELAGRNYTVTAMDLFALQLGRLSKKAKDQGLTDKVTPVEADMNGDFPFEDGEFGTVVSLRANRYVKDFGHWLGEAHRITEPGGTLVLPVFAVDTVPWKRNADEGMRQPASHNAVMHAIIDAGFEVDEQASVRYSQAVDQSLGQRDVPFYYKPSFVVAEAQQ